MILLRLILAFAKTGLFSIGGGLAPASGKGCRGFNGYMDEVRLRPGIVSADWIKADYDTVNNPTFVTIPAAASASLPP